MEFDLVPAGEHEVVIATTEDAKTRSGNYMKRLTMVVVSYGSPYAGALLYAFAVDTLEARFLWEDAVDHPASFNVGQRYIATLTGSVSVSEGGMRVLHLSQRPGDDRAPHRETELPEEPKEPAHYIRGESASGPSAMERERKRIQDTVETYLFEAAEPGPQTEPQPYADGRGQSGIVIPDSGLPGGAIVTSGFARRFGAQLIRAADIHDRIQDATYVPPSPEQE
jgi:hypothetical protein